MPYAIINECPKQDVAIILPFGSTILKIHFMINILRERLKSHAELYPLLISNIRILTRGEAVARDEQLNVPRVIFIFIKFADSDLH